jgi:MFS family permease
LQLVSASTGASGYRELLRDNRAFRLLWMGEVVSLLGDWFGLIASATLVAQLTGSGMAVGGLFVARMLPPFLISPVAGVAADRYDRKKLLVLSDLVRMVLVLGFLLVREPSHVWLLYALTALQMAFSGVFFPTRNAILPGLVNDRQLGAANALSSATWSTMLALGSALGGLVASRFGVATAFVIDALSYLVSAGFLAMIRCPGGACRETRRSVGNAAREYLEGLSYLVYHREILFTSLHKAIFGLTIGGSMQVVVVALAHQVFAAHHDGSAALGWMYAAAGAGTGLGPIIARQLSGDRRETLRRAIVVAYAMVSLGLLITAPVVGLGVVLLGQFVRGVGGGINWVFSTQLLLMALPDRVRGRVFSTEFALFTLAQATGTVIGGWALDHAGLSLSQLMFVLACLPLAPGALWLLWIRRRQRDEEGGAP